MKNSIKRVVALAVAAIMLLCIAPIAYAEDFTVTIGSATAKPGDSIGIDITVDGMPFASIGGMSLNLAFDSSVLEFVDYAGGEIVPNESDLDIAESFEGNVYVAFTTADEPIVTAGKLVTLNFNVKSDAANGSYELVATSASKVTDNDLNVVVKKDDFNNFLMAGTLTISGGSDSSTTTPDDSDDDDKDDTPVVPDDTTPEGDINIISVEPVTLKVNTGLTAKQVIDRLPKTVTVKADAAWNGSSKSGEWEVTWSANSTTFYGSQAGTYTFTGVLTPKDGFAIAEDVVPTAKVTVSKPISDSGYSSGLGSSYDPILSEILGATEEEEEAVEIRFIIGGNSFTFNGRTSYMDVAFMYNDAGDRTLVPVRFISEVLGYTVDWDPATQNVTITKDDHNIVLTIGSETMYSDGKAVQMDTAPIIYGDRTFVPIRFVAENFGLEVGFDNATQEVTLISVDE